ncbi:MAG TPA: hypothetical protein VK626_09845 [Nitrospiraceae bacterium]|nr:hypothetical protein [Nitrospiraceae bacterium]
MDVLDGYPLKRKAIQIRERICAGLALGFLTACGPHAHIPLRPANLLTPLHQRIAEHSWHGA